MKRLLALLCTAALALVMTSSADAGIALKWRSEAVQWRTGNGGQQDSASARTIHTQTTFDTTKAFAFGDYVRIPNYPMITSATDSMLAFALEVSTGGTAITASGYDSTILVTQVSNDASTWTTVTPTAIFDATRAAGSRGTIIAHQLLTDGSTAQGFMIHAYDFTNTLGRIGTVFTSVASTAPNDQQLFGWKYIRWIVNGSGGQGEFYARFWHWTDFDD